MSGYIGPIPVPQGIQNKETFTATAGQTTFNTNGYTDGAFISVYLNGVRLINGTDYTATNGSDVVLTSAAAASDVVDFESFNSFSLVDQTFDNVTLKNPTHEDTDGGRESAVSFKGEQSGGEISTLAAIQASHDGTSDDQKGDLIFKTNDGSDNDAPTEAARIDSDRHFIVGKTAADSGATAGIELRNDGNARFTKAGATATFNRLTSDGTVATFQKDGTTIGTIGNASTTLDVSATGDFMQFTNANNQIAFGSASTPALAGNGSANDAAIDLGRTNRRWQNLYLSGGAYLGGTAAANYLNDYEEGTWTPTVSSGGATLGNISGSSVYTKIGNFVHVQFYINSLASTTSSSFRVDGLPFANIANGQTVGSIMHQSVDLPGARTTLVAYVPSSGTIVRFYAVGDNIAWQELIGTNVGTSFNLIVNIQYRI